MRALRLGAACAAAAPGLLAGGYLAALLWFLNPDLPLDPPRIVATVAAYATVLGLAALLLQAPQWTGRRPDRSWRAIPWTLAAVLLGGAIAYAAQASYFAFYLPAGINVRLLKAASWLCLGAVVALVTAIVHSWNRRPYGARSRTGLWLVALASLLVVFERREAYRPDPAPTFASAVGSPRALSLVVVGVDGALPEVVLPLAEQGQLPFFHRMIRNGTFARVRPLRPERVLPGWTTVATGKYPFRHGVRSDTVIDPGRWPPWYGIDLLPVGLALDAWSPFGPPREVTAADRRARTLWEILPLLGRPAAVIGWPLVTPSALRPGFALDDAFFRGRNPLPPDPALAARAALFRPSDADLSALLGPDVAAHRDQALAGLEQDVWRASVGRATLVDSGGGPTALFLRLPGLAPVSRRTFDGYEARVLRGETASRFLADTNTLGGYYRRIDEILAGLWADLAQGPAILVVISPSGERRSTSWTRIVRPGAEAPAVADGLFLVLGENVRAGTVLPDLDPVDVMPTILYALGLPQARDLDGSARTDAFDPGFVARQPLAFVPSYDTLTRGG